MISLLPNEKIQIKSILPQDKVLEALNKNLLPPAFRILGGDGKFHGKIIGKEFSMRRQIAYRNSFLPTIKGLITSGENSGSDIKVQMRMPIFVQAFSMFWFAAVIWACLVFMYHLARQFFLKQNLFVDPTDLIPFGMLVFGIAIVWIPFKIETRQAKKFLISVLQANAILND